MMQQSQFVLMGFSHHLMHGIVMFRKDSFLPNFLSYNITRGVRGHRPKKKWGKTAWKRLKIKKKGWNFGTIKFYKNEEISWKEELSHPWFTHQYFDTNTVRSILISTFWYQHGKCIFKLACQVKNGMLDHTAMHPLGKVCMCGGR